MGYPTDGGFGAYVSCTGCIAMNGKTQKKETAIDFLQYLLSEEVQTEIGIETVRRDILACHVKEQENGGEGPVYISDGAYVPLTGKEDGSSWLPEYLEVLEQGAAEPVWLEGAGLIVMEEASVCFNGDKTAEETVQVIQNRVQLYLDCL